MVLHWVPLVAQAPAAGDADPVFGCQRDPRGQRRRCVVQVRSQPGWYGWSVVVNKCARVPTQHLKIPHTGLRGAAQGQRIPVCVTTRGVDGGCALTQLYPLHTPLHTNS